MAKQTKNTAPDAVAGPSNLDDMLSALVKQHNNIAPMSASFGEEEIGSTVTTWIPTGSIALDSIISNKEVGGWPCGRVCELYGEQAYGKSSICFQAMANCQAMGGVVIFFDIEHAASSELMEGYGIDMSKILYSNLDKVEDIFDAIEKNLTLLIASPSMKGKPIFICVDSLAAMKSKKLEEGTYDYNMGTQGEFAKILGLALKRSLSLLSKANACLVVINQLRDKIGVIGGDTKFAPGGNALKFYATLRLRLLGKKMIEVSEEITGDKVPIGAEVTVRTDKNKLGPPIRKVDFNLIFTSGINEYENWLGYLVNIKLLTRGGAWYGFAENFPLKQYAGKKFQRPDFEDFLEDAELFECLQNAIRKAFVRPTNDTEAIKAEQIEAAKIME